MEDPQGSWEFYANRKVPASIGKDRQSTKLNKDVGPPKAISTKQAGKTTQLQACCIPWKIKDDSEGGDYRMSLSEPQVIIFKLKRDNTNELNSQNRKRLTNLVNELMVVRGEWRREEIVRSMSLNVQTVTFKMNNQQGPTV